jgi:hypothetical protein
MAGAARFLHSSKVTAPRQEPVERFFTALLMFLRSVYGKWSARLLNLVFQGEEMAFDVGYDENDRIDKVTVLKKK